MSRWMSRLITRRRLRFIITTVPITGPITDGAGTGNERGRSRRSVCVPQQAEAEPEPEIDGQAGRDGVINLHVETYLQPEHDGGASKDRDKPSDRLPFHKLALGLGIAFGIV